MAVLLTDHEALAIYQWLTGREQESNREHREAAMHQLSIVDRPGKLLNSPCRSCGGQFV